MKDILKITGGLTLFYFVVAPLLQYAISYIMYMVLIHSMHSVTPIPVPTPKHTIQIDNCEEQEVVTVRSNL